jgi:hypothetical protein
MMEEAVGTSETSVNLNVTTRSYIPEDSKLQIPCMLIVLRNCARRVCFLVLGFNGKTSLVLSGGHLNHPGLQHCSSNVSFQAVTAITNVNKTYKV